MISSDPLADVVAQASSTEFLFRTGTITTVQASPARVVVNVSGSLMTLPHLGFGPSVGDKVIVLARPGAWIVLGAIGKPFTGGGGGGTEAHTHTESDVTNLAADLAGKAPTSHTHTLAAHATTHASAGSDPITPASIGAESAVNKGAVNGYASLGSGALVPRAQLPDASTTDYGVVRLGGDVQGAAGALTVPGLAGKAALAHTHGAADVASGTLDIARLPVGSTSTTVAVGNHTHSGSGSGPIGVIARGRRITNSATTTAASAPIGVIRLDATVTAGRLYRLQVADAMFTNVATTSVSQTLASYFYYTTNGTAATTASTVLDQVNIVAPDGMAPGFQIAKTQTAYYTPTVSGPLSLCWGFIRAGTINFYVLCSGTFPLDITIEDIGADPGSTSTNL